MQNNAKPLMSSLIFFSAVLLSPIALAETASEALTKIESETLVLKAREKQLEVQSSIIGRQNEIAAKQNAADTISQHATASNPLVRAIEGIGGKMFATLQLEDGNIIEVQVGDVLSNGMRVESIRQNEVVVKTKKGRVHLAAYVPKQAVTAAYPGAGLMLPMPISIPNAQGISRQPVAVQAVPRQLAPGGGQVAPRQAAGPGAAIGPSIAR